MNGQIHPFGLKLKLDFDINVDLSDIMFTNGNIRKYNENSNNVFGEKLCLIYTFDFTIYNVQFSVKILAFAYEKSSEILKLDIDIISNKHIEKEAAIVRNFLQRHRNLNAAFTTLIQFSKFVETRRLISAIVIAKEPKVVISKHADGGVMIKYLDNLSNVLIAIYWKIDWSLKESMVVDVIEVYYNNFVLPNANDIKLRLTNLTHPTLDFHTKLKLWKLLMADLRKNTKSTIQTVITITEPVSEADSVLVISDNEEDNNNKNPSEISKNKRRKVEPQVCSSSVIYVVPD